MKRYVLIFCEKASLKSLSVLKLMLNFSRIARARCKYACVLTLNC